MRPSLVHDFFLIHKIQDSISTTQKKTSNKKIYKNCENKSHNFWEQLSHDIPSHKHSNTSFFFNCVELSILPMLQIIAKTLSWMLWLLIESKHKQPKRRRKCINWIVISKTHGPQNYFGQNLLWVLMGTSCKSTTKFVVLLKAKTNF